MLDPKDITNAMVTAFQSIPAVVTAMSGDASRIVAYHFIFGEEQPLASTIFEMKAPAIVVAWEGSGAGQLSMMTLWRHRFAVYFRVANQAGQPTPMGAETLWRTMLRSPINGGTEDIRTVALLTTLYPMTQMPSVEHRVDADGLDYFCGHFVFDEIGDQ